ncbi:MAG: malonyl-[acyl-carrier protein] O-methyltransferase BioC, partial [Gammaproteobacteria bacterium]
HNVNVGRRRTLTGKDRLRRMLQSYETRRRDNRLPATYEVIYGHAWRGVHARRIDSQTAVFPISGLRRSRRGQEQDAG